MPQIINTNIASMTAQRNLNNSQSANETAMNRLSSGLRINSAKDDAAGLAISTRFDSQIKGLNVAVRNAGDGVSLAQTAEGALGSMTENLQRIRELAVQSANSTNSDEDRIALQSEVDQLISEIGRTAEETTFNGRKLLDGSFQGTFQIGANAGQTIDVNIAELTTSKLGSSDQVGVTASATDDGIDNGDLIINGVAIGPSVAEDDNASTDNAEASAISKAAAINRYTDQTGVTAFANETVAAGSEMTGATGTTTLTLNGVDIDLETSSDTAQTRAAVAQAINAVSEQTGVMATDTGSDSKGLQLTAADGRNIQIAFGGGTGGTATDATAAAATGIATEGTYEGGFTLVASGDTKKIEVSGGNNTGNGDLARTGLTAGTFDRAVGVTNSEVKTETASVATLFGAGSLANQVAAAADDVTRTSADDTFAFSVKVGDTTTNIVETTDQQTLAAVAAQFNAIDGVTAYEQIDVQITGAGAATDGQLFGIGGSTVTLSDVSDLGKMADDINGGTFGANIEVSAQLNDAGTAINLSIKNYSGAQLALTGSTGLVEITDSTGAANIVATDVLSGAVKVQSDNGEDITVQATDTTATGASGTLLAAADLEETYSFTAVNGLSDGDLAINGVSISAADTNADTASATKSSDGFAILSSDKSKSAIAIASSINKVSDETGVEASVNATKVIGGDGLTAAEKTAFEADFEAGDTGGIFINGVNVGSVVLQNETGSTTSLDTSKARTDAINLINQSSGQTGVTAEDNGESITLTAADGRNVSVAINDESGNERSIGALFGLDAGEDGIGESTFGSTAGANATTSSEAQTYETTYGTIKLSSAKEFTIDSGTNGKDEVEALGLEVGSFGGNGEDGQFLKDVDISTFEGAQAALTAVDNALKTISSQRADLGAVQNRFESTMDNLAINAENLSAANSRVKDADFAKETAEMSRTQVLQQAGISILAQANQKGQSVLSLLG